MAKKNEQYLDMAKAILAAVGGQDNISSATHCMTRLRLNLKDESVPKDDEIKAIDGVIGVNRAGDQYQVIIGPAVPKVYDAFTSLGHLEKNAAIDENLDGEKTEKKEGFLKILSSIFVPLLPAIIASGFMQGIGNIFNNWASDQATASGMKATETLTAAQVYLQQNHLLMLGTLITMLGTALFSFLAIYTGFTAAKVFKTDPILGAVLGAMTTLPALTIIGLTPGKGGLFGVILGVYILSKLDFLLKKIVPNVVDIVLRPTLTLFITGFLYVLILMPITGWLSDLLIKGLMGIINGTGIFGGFVLGALFPSLIVTGLHQGLTPINMQLIEQLGATPLMTVQIMSNSGMVGAGLAIVLLSKSKKVKEVAKGVLPATFLAVGEPTMYGLVLPSGYGWITASLGAGVGGIMIRLFDVQASAIGAAGVSAIPLIADGKYLQYIISYVISFVAAFIFTYSWGKFRHKSLEL